jgi:hypothetical protein
MNNKAKVNYLLAETFLAHYNSLYDVEFTFRSFQRTFRGYFSFAFLSEFKMSLKSKMTGKSIIIENVGSNYYQVNYTGSRVNYLFFIETNKEFIKKILKHNIY